MPMPKSSTQFNSNELTSTKEKNTHKLKSGIIRSILSFSRSFQVETSGIVSKIEYNIN